MPPGGTGANPYTAQRAGVGKKLKNYASKLFQGSATSPLEGMDASLHLEDIRGTGSPSGRASGDPSSVAETTNGEQNSHGGGAVSGQRQSWIPFRRNGSVTLTQSESNLDAGWTLGSSLRGLRRRGLRNSLPVGSNMGTQAEVGESSSSSGEGENGEESLDENKKDKDRTTNGGEIDRNLASTEDEKEDNNLNEVLPNREDDDETGANPQSTPIKNRLKAPGLQKFFESARW